MITISPGHWSNTGSGASGFINEVTEARKVTNRVIQILRANGVIVNHVEDNTSKNQQQNLGYIVSQHNKTSRKLDVSVHFNATGTTKNPIGCEVLYYDQLDLAKKVSASMAKAGGFKDRGAKKRTELAFLANTNKPAILLEVCFVSSEEDSKLYKQNFEQICQAIAKDLANYVGKNITTNNGNEVLSMSQYNELKQLITTLQNENSQLKQQLANKLDKPASREVSASHKEGWQWLINNGISNGANPEQYLSREQMGTLLKRYNDKFDK